MARKSSLRPAHSVTPIMKEGQTKWGPICGVLWAGRPAKLPGLTTRRPIRTRASLGMRKR
ncbi:hypothetical protein WDU94_011969 [Cyamophila willieti]